MLGVVQAVGVGKAGVLAAKGLRLGVHSVHKGVHAAADRLGQHVAGLVGRNHQHTLEVIFHAHGFPHLNPGGAAVGGKSGQRGGGGGIQRKLALIHGLQRQQSGHNFCQTGGV